MLDPVPGYVSSVWSRPAEVYHDTARMIGLIHLWGEYPQERCVDLQEFNCYFALRTIEIQNPDA